MDGLQQRALRDPCFSCRAFRSQGPQTQRPRLCAGDILLMIEILLRPIYSIYYSYYRRFLQFWYMRSCRISIINNKGPPEKPLVVREDSSSFGLLATRQARQDARCYALLKACFRSSGHFLGGFPWDKSLITWVWVRGTLTDRKSGWPFKNPTMPLLESTGCNRI